MIEARFRYLGRPLSTRCGAKSPISSVEDGENELPDLSYRVVVGGCSDWVECCLLYFLAPQHATVGRHVPRSSRVCGGKSPTEQGVREENLLL